MQFKHLFSLSLSLTFVACQVSAPLTQVSEGSLAVTPTYTAQVPQEQIRVTLGNTPGFTTQEAQIDQLAFVQIMVTGEGITTPITQKGGLIAVSNGNVNASVAGIPQNDGKMRFVEVQGYDANRQPLVGLKAKAWYRSKTNVNTVNITASRSQNLLVDVLKALASSRPNVLTSLNINALQTVLLEALDYDADTQTFGQQPESLSGSAIAALITTDQNLPDAATVSQQSATLQTVSLTVTTQNTAPLPEDVRLVLNDAVSLPRLLKTNTNSGIEVSFNHVPEGDYTLEARNVDNTVIARTTVSVGTTVTVAADPLVLPFNAPVPRDLQINTFVSDAQQRPEVASDDSGNFVATWSSNSQDGSDSGVYAQRYNAAGVAQGSEFRVNDYTGGSQSEPAIAMDTDGDFVITWTSSTNGVYAQRYNAAGVAQGSEFRVNGYTGGSQSDPAIAMDTDGDFVITWTSGSQDGSDNGVYARRYNPTGVAQDSEFRVNTYTSSSQDESAIAMDDSGNFVITWSSDDQDGDEEGIYAQRYNTAGVPQDSEFRVNTYTEDDQARSDVAMDADGDFVVTWNSYIQDGYDYGIYAQRYNAAGEPQGSEFQVSQFTDSDAEDPSIAIDADGDFVITWTSSGQDGNGNGVYARKYTASGSALTSEFLVNLYTSSAQTYPDVALDSDGDFVVVWQSDSQDGSSLGIFAQRYDATGTRKE